MTELKTTGRKMLAVACAVLVALTAAAGAAAAQKRPKKPEPTTGSIRGRVRVDAGATPAGVAVVVRRGDEEVARATTNAKGEFEVQGLAPGSYGLTVRKAGLQVGKAEEVEVRAGKTRSLKELFLPLDEGAIVFIRGSVFNAAGMSLPGARVELARVETDGSLRRLDSRVSNSTGSFGFRLLPESGRYRLTAKADGMESASEDVNVEGAAIYRVALSLNPARK